MKSNKTKSAMTALVIAAMLCSAAMPIRAAEAQWVNNNGTWSYVKEDGSKAKGWIKDNNCWYAFDDNGAMRTGWIASNEHWYFMGESGVMQAAAWVEDNGARYYIKGNGVMAKDYVKETIADIPETSYLFGLKKKKVYPKMYLTGHSKGGNLAMYAYLKNPKLQGYIESVKSFDGPGFADGFWQGDEDVSKITNYIPKDSIVGRVLDHREQTKVMDAEGSGLVQHDTLMWSVDIKDFNYCDALTKESDDLLEYVNKLLMNRPLEEKERYCHLIGELFDRMEIYTIADLTEFSFKQALSGIKEIRQLNAEEIKFMFEIVKFIAVQSAPILVKGRK